MRSQEEQAQRLLKAHELLRSMDLGKASIKDIDHVLTVAGVDPSVVHNFVRQMLRVHIKPSPKPSALADQIEWAAEYLQNAVTELIYAGAGLECVMMALKAVIKDVNCEYSYLGKVNGEKQCCKKATGAFNRPPCRTNTSE